MLTDTLATTVSVRSEGSVTLAKESTADTSIGRSGPPMPASSVARSSRSGQRGSGGSDQVKASGR